VVLASNAFAPTATLLAPVVFDPRAKFPKAELLPPVLTYKVESPQAVFPPFTVTALKLLRPMATFPPAVVLASKALAPTATFAVPVVFAVSAALPTAVLSLPVVNESSAVLPTFTFASVNPIPNLPAVIATPTFIFCRNVAFVLVLIFSVLATPVKFDPSPTKLPPPVIVTFPLVTLIPSLAVINPTESIFVTSS